MNKKPRQEKAPAVGRSNMLRAGVDLGGTKIQTVIVDPNDEVLGSHRRFTPTTGGPTDVADAIAQSIEAAMQDGLVDAIDVTGVGIGSPGQIDKAAGTVSHAGNLPGWAGSFSLGPYLTERLGAPVFLGNDVQVAVQAEAELGAGKPYSSFLGIFVGTGIGGSVVLDRKLWLGRGAAGEIGHTVVELNGALCPCGRRGCCEAYAGRAAMEITARKWHDEGRPTCLFTIMKKKGRTRLASGVWARALARKDAMAEELIGRAVAALGAAAGSAVNLLDVQAVIIGGGLGCRLGEPFVESIRDAAYPHLVMPDRPPDFRLAALGDLGGALGAALLARDGTE